MRDYARKCARRAIDWRVSSRHPVMVRKDYGHFVRDMHETRVTVHLRGLAGEGCGGAVLTKTYRHM